MRMSPSTVSLLLATTLAVACGNDEAAPDTPSPKQALATLTSDALPGVTEAIPAQLATTLSFTAALAEDDELAAIIPANWTASRIPGSFNPPDESKLGFMTRFSVGGNCDGACSPKDWVQATNKVEFDQFKGEQFTITKDEALGDNGRLLVATSQTSTYIVAAWWKKDASKYYYCRASLADDAALAAAAFERACLSTRVLAW